MAIPFEEKMAKLATQWRGAARPSAEDLMRRLSDNLKRLGFGVNKEETR